MPLSLSMRLMSKYEGGVDDCDDHDEVGDADEDISVIEEHEYVCSQ